MVRHHELTRISGTFWHLEDEWCLYSLILLYKGAGDSFKLTTHRQIVEFFKLLFHSDNIDSNIEHLDGRKFVFHIIDAGFRASKGLKKGDERIIWPLYELSARIIADTDGIEFKNQDISCVLRAFNHFYASSSRAVYQG